MSPRACQIARTAQAGRDAPEETEEEETNRYFSEKKRGKGHKEGKFGDWYWKHRGEV